MDDNKRNTRRLSAACVVLLVTLPLWSCDENPTKAEYDITVIGTLTGEGVECRAMRDDAGRLYTLAGDTSGYEDGKRVCVRGSLPDFSHCMQGTTIGVDWIGPAAECQD